MIPIMIEKEQVLALTDQGLTIFSHYLGFEVICIVIFGVRSMMIGELLVISTMTRNHRPISTTTMAIPPMRGIAFGL